MLFMVDFPNYLTHEQCAYVRVHCLVVQFENIDAHSNIGSTEAAKNDGGILTIRLTLTNKYLRDFLFL